MIANYLLGAIVIGATPTYRASDLAAVAERWPEALHDSALDEPALGPLARLDQRMLSTGQGDTPLALLKLAGKRVKQVLSEVSSVPQFTHFGLGREEGTLHVLLVDRSVDIDVKPAWVDGKYMRPFRFVEGEGGGIIETGRGVPELRLFSLYRGGRYDQRVLTEPHFRVSRSSELMALHLLVDGQPAWRWVSAAYRSDLQADWAACGEKEAGEQSSKRSWDGRSWDKVVTCLRARRELSDLRSSPTLSGVAHQYASSLARGWARGTHPSSYLSVRGQKPAKRPWAHGLSAKRVWESLGTLGKEEGALDVLYRWLWSPAHTTVLFNAEATHFGGAAIAATDSSPGIFVVVMRR